MTGDRTQHVLDAIDGALADAAVSPDAMRWTPEEAGSRDAGDRPGAPIFGHRPDCSIVHEYVDRPPSCQCGALDRAWRSIAGGPAIDWQADPLPQPRQNGRASIHISGPVYYVDEVTDLPSLVPWQQHVADVVLEPALRYWHQTIDRLVLQGGRGFGRTARLAALLDRHESSWRRLWSNQLVVDGPDDEDLRVRALRLRRQRGTGPGRAPAGQQKRPRSLT